MAVQWVRTQLVAIAQSRKDMHSCDSVRHYTKCRMHIFCCVARLRRFVCDCHFINLEANPVEVAAWGLRDGARVAPQGLFTR